MQVVFVGGASGVGASCLAVEIAEQWIVVDAGVRVDRKSDPLPDLSLLEGKDVRAIFVTHAHADHIGALPLVHQAFPTAPIFASRATGLLMEVMLADALKIMNRRAVEEMEIPLYPRELMSSMLNQVRPLPIGKTLTLPQLPDITISTNRAGHIAGAISFGFTGPDGTLVVSGDISSTPQRTVLGALPPSVERCDMLVLESTYGSRLHPNRQGEEQRLAQAVAESVERGGHTLIPCFGLGRGQELLLILQAAQEKGQVLDFPIYVDGLVRRVCSTYLLLPEALPPVLQRQIRKGYLPFTGRNVSFVRDERDRERILAGPPACILSSSGMLTGGPSAWYARRLAPLANASILITGYQDEEAPGKRLLDLAEKKNSTLDLDGTSVPVNCTIAKYSLSAHADGGELAAYAAALKPQRVALVHGDEEARYSLRRLLGETEVFLPENGATLTPKTASGKAKKKSPSAPALATLPSAIGAGRVLTDEDLPELWQTVTQMPSLRIVTARELAALWYGESSEEATTHILAVLSHDNEQRFFIRQQALEEAYRVRGQAEETPGDFLADLVGKILLLEISPGSSKPVLCLGIETGARIRVLHPKSTNFVRTRYPFASILDILGDPPTEALTDHIKAVDSLDTLVKTARRIRRRFSAHMLAQLCQEEATYTLGDLCQLAGVSARSLEDRLAVAKILHKNPLIFMQQRTLMEGEGLTLYGLAPEWREAHEESEEPIRPDQNWLQELVQKYLSHATDLYRRSIDPDTGEITLAFHFPEIASKLYATQLEALRAEANVPVNIAPQPHQGQLISVVRQVLPHSLSERGFPSIHHERHVVQVKCQGSATAEEIAQAQETFSTLTDWQLELSLQTPGSPTEQPLTQQTEHAVVQVDQHNALHIAQTFLRNQPGYVKVGAELGTNILNARFYFPEIARQRYADLFAQIEAQTGWPVQVLEGIHQEALIRMARSLLPQGLTPTHSPSIYHKQHAVLLQCSGSAPQEEILAAQDSFARETGWQLTITVPGSREEMEEAPRMSQSEAMAHITARFIGIPELYRVGTDMRLKIFWLHFYFPEKARERYADLLTTLETETGWRIYLHPNVHQKMLVETARELVPASLSLSGKKKIYEETRTLHLLYTAPEADEKTLKPIKQQFTERTCWSLELEHTAE